MINKKNNNRKLPIILIITSFLIVLLSFAYNNRYLNKINIFFSNIGNSIHKFLIIKNVKLDENIQLGINKELEYENQELKEMLNFKINDYDMITSVVLKRNIDWYQSLTIDKGKKDGIKENMSVVSSNGLIGKIKNVSTSSSEVELITSNKIKTSVDVVGNNIYHGILTNYDKNTNLITVEDINKYSDISINDSVYTNGLGEIIPSGIYIGKVVEITTDNLDLNKILKIKPDINYDNIKYVYIIRR